jgi:hypothetical protein
MAKEVHATTNKVTSTRQVIKDPPAPQQVRIYHKTDGTYQDVFPVDAKEAVLGGEYTMEAPVVPLVGENVHKPIRPETVTGLMPEMGVPLADLANAAGAAEEDDAHMKLRGPLPEDFPSRAALDAAGYGTYARLRKQVAKGEGWHKDVAGIGDKSYGPIEDALKEK